MMKSILIGSFILFLFYIPGMAQEAIYYGVPSKIISFEDTSEYKYIKIDSTGVWEIARPSKEILFLPENSSYLGEWAILTEPDSAYYDTNVFSSFEFKLIIGGADIYVMGFEHKYDFEPNKDGGIIETSYDLGETWSNLLYDTNIFNHLDDIFNFYSEEDQIAAYNNQPGFTGTQSEMEIVNIFFRFNDELEDDTLMVRFLITSDSIDSGNEGWMLDEIGFGGGFVPIESDNNARITIFPNPVIDNLIIDASEIPVERIEIIDLMGTILFSSGNQTLIQMEDYKPGMYFLRINNMHSYKIVKI